MNLQIQAGEYYIRRDGQIAGPAEPYTGNDVYVWQCGGARKYRDDGAYLTDELSFRDLVAHLPRTDLRHPEHCGENPLQINISTVASEPGQQSATIDIEPDPRMSAGNWWLDYDGQRCVLVEAHGGFYRQYGAAEFCRHSWHEEHENPLVKHLPDCYGFDWEPELEPEPIDVGEGWRLLGNDETIVQGDEMRAEGTKDQWNAVLGSIGDTPATYLGGEHVVRRRSDRRFVDMITWLCQGRSGMTWTHDTGATNDPPTHAIGIVKRWTAEVEDMP